MSPTAGISFLDRIFLQEIQTRSSTRAVNEEAAFIGDYLNRCSKSGTRYWPAKTTEWFVIAMLTQLLVTPHSLHTGRTIPEIQNAYLPLVRDLVSAHHFCTTHPSLNKTRKLDEAQCSNDTNR